MRGISEDHAFGKGGGEPWDSNSTGEYLAKLLSLAKIVYVFSHILTYSLVQSIPVWDGSFFDIHLKVDFSRSGRDSHNTQ